MTKRVLSMLLALIMALSLCVPAFAADEPEVITDEPATIAVDEPAPAVVIQISDEDSLKDALSQKQAEIQIVGDVTLNTAMTIDWALSLSIAAEKTLTLSANTEIKEGGSLTVSGTGKMTGTVQNAGTLTVGGAELTGLVTNSGTLTLNSGSILAITSSKGAVTIAGGTVPGDGSNTTAVNITGGNLTVSAGTIAGKYDDAGTTWAGTGSVKNGITIAKEAGTILISGGSIGGSTNSLDVGQGKRNNSISVTGGTFETAIKGGDVPGFITGGKFMGATALDAELEDVAVSATVAAVDTAADGVDYWIVGKAAVEEAGEALKAGTVSVKQGDADFENIQPGVTVKNEGEGTVTVDGEEIDDELLAEGYVVKIGNQGYKTLREALEAAKTGETIVLLTTVTPGEAVAIPGSGSTATSLTIDLNGQILDMATNKITVTDVAVTFTGNGNIVGESGGAIEIATTTEKSAASVSLVNTYSQLPLTTSSATNNGKASASVDADSVVSEIGATFKGSATVAGTVTGQAQITGAATVSGEVAGNLTIILADDETASVTGEVGGSLKITGTGKATVNATVKGTSNFGESTSEMDLTVSGGEYTGKVTVDIEKHSDVSIADGVFNAASSSITVSGVTNVISGGAYKEEPTDTFVVEDGVVAKVDDDPQPLPKVYESPLGATDGYYFVGSDIAEALAQITDGSLEVKQGDLTLASIGDKIDVITDSDASLKVGNVTVGASATVTGEKINELNGLITTAQKAQVSGQLTDEALQELVTAYTAALKDQTQANIQDSIDDLKAALEGYEEEDAPTAPASGTGWVETASGEWYYFNKGEMVKNQWVESGRALWYYMNPDGTLAHGGFTLVPACRGINKDGKDAGTFAAGYFYLRHNNYNGCIGQARHGTVAIEASAVTSVPAKGTGVFETKHNGHYGACVSINGKAVKNYTELPA